MPTGNVRKRSRFCSLSLTSFQSMRSVVVVVADIHTSSCCLTLLEGTDDVKKVSLRVGETNENQYDPRSPNHSESGRLGVPSRRLPHEKPFTADGEERDDEEQQH